MVCMHNTSTIMHTLEEYAYYAYHTTLASMHTRVVCIQSVVLCIILLAVVCITSHQLARSRCCQNHFQNSQFIIFVYFTRPSFHGLGLTMKMWTEAKGEEEGIGFIQVGVILPDRPRTR